MKRFVLGIAGIFCILLGIVGWLLPILPGWLFIFVGLSLLAPEATARLRRRIWRRLYKKAVIPLDEWGSLPVLSGFTTKHFSVSISKTDDLSDPGRQKSLIDAFSADETARSIQALRSGHVVFMNQVHQDHVAVIGKTDLADGGGFCRLALTDGVITDLPNVTLLALTADCLSVFLYAGPAEGDRERARPWIGLVHAGWRGTKKGITRKAFGLLSERSGCRAENIKVALGPSIGARAYEVGREFGEFFPDAIGKTLKSKGGRFLFDLAGENRRQLISAGADPRNISDHGICTFSEKEHFYSYRREGDKAGRMISFIVLRKAGVSS